MKNDNKISKTELTSLVREIVKEVINGIEKSVPKVGVYPADFKSVPNYIRIKKTNVPGEFMVAWYINGKFDDNKTYYTHDLTDAYDTFKHMKQSVDAANGVKEQTATAAVSPVTGPMAFKKKNKPMEGLEPLGGMEEEEKKLEEMTTTSGGGGSSAGTPGYNVPGAFSKRGGSKKGVEGSAALGYTLTSIGKDEMNRTADKLLENKKK